MSAAAMQSSVCGSCSAPAAAAVSDDPRMGSIVQHMTLEQFTAAQAAMDSYAGDEDDADAAQQQQQRQQRRRPAVVVTGFPHDEGCRRNGGRVGAAGGPGVVRAFMQKMGTVVNPETKIDLRTIDLFDVGDVAKDIDLESAHASLESRVTKLMHAGPHVIPFVVGGSNDQSYPNAAALMNELGHGKIGVINIDAHLDVRPLKDGLAHSGSPFRQLLEDERFAAAVNGGAAAVDGEEGEGADADAAGAVRKQPRPLALFAEFAAQGNQCSQQHADFVTHTHGQRIYWLSELRARIDADSLQQQQPTSAAIAATPASQPRGMAKQFSLALDQLQAEHIFVSFDLDAVTGADAPGVSCPGSIGLSASEALDMCFVAGSDPRVRLFDLSEFNPAVDDYRTGRLVANMWYWFCMGVASRK